MHGTQKNMSGILHRKGESMRYFKAIKKKDYVSDELGTYRKQYNVDYMVHRTEEYVRDIAKKERLCEYNVVGTKKGSG